MHWPDQVWHWLAAHFAVPHFLQPPLALFTPCVKIFYANIKKKASGGRRVSSCICMCVCGVFCQYFGVCCLFICCWCISAAAATAAVASSAWQIVIKSVRNANTLETARTHPHKCSNTNSHRRDLFCCCCCWRRANAKRKQMPLHTFGLWNYAASK